MKKKTQKVARVAGAALFAAALAFGFSSCDNSINVKHHGPVIVVSPDKVVCPTHPYHEGCPSFSSCSFQRE